MVEERSASPVQRMRDSTQLSLSIGRDACCLEEVLMQKALGALVGAGLSGTSESGKKIARANHSAQRDCCASSLPR